MTSDRKDFSEAIEMYRRGVEVREIAARLQITANSLWKAFKKRGIFPPKKRCVITRYERRRRLEDADVEARYGQE